MTPGRRPGFHALRSAALGLGALALAACGVRAPTAEVRPAGPPMRIASINLCTDRLLMLLAPPERIASITFLSQMRQDTPPDLLPLARSLRANHGLAEELLTQKPDLVLAGTYTTRATVSLLRRLGFRVEEFAPETSFADIRANIRRMGEVLGETQRSDAMIAAFDARLATLRADAGPVAAMPVFADVGVNRWTPGRGTLSAEIAHAGGYRTLGEALGFSGSQAAALEQLALSRPDAVALDTVWSDPPSMATNELHHPAMRRMADGAAHIAMDGRLATCGTPAVLDAAATLAEARRRQPHRIEHAAP